jgi:hypothetical protein
MMLQDENFQVVRGSVITGDVIGKPIISARGCNWQVREQRPYGTSPHLREAKDKDKHKDHGTNFLNVFLRHETESSIYVFVPSAHTHETASENTQSGRYTSQ